MTTYFSVNGININTIFAAAGAADGSNNTLTGYTTGSGTAIKFLKPFYAGISTTANETIYNTDPLMYATANFLSNSANLKFCPPYVFYKGNESTAFTAGSSTTHSAGTTATTSNVTPPVGVTRMLVILVGGGGGGGGGGSKSNGGAGGGGGGGAGAINIYSIPYTTGNYTINVGGGGLYGYTNGNQAGGPGDEDNTSPNNPGAGGGSGTGTNIVYGGITHTTNGGSGGSGGANTAGGSAGTGATTTTINSTLIYSYAGNNGSTGSYGSTANPGGAGGTPKYNETINTNILKVISNQVSLTNNNISTSTKLQYGEGGKGGKGDNADNWGWNGEFGAPGCAFVFYFYN
jgi:hypothetical protein